MDQDISNKPPRYPNNQSSKGSSMAKPLTVIILLIIFAALGFWGGISYEKGHDKTTPTANAASSGFSGGGGGGGSAYGGRFSGQRPSIGTVSAISSTSISVQDSRTNTTVTLAITSSTTITDNGQSASVGDIQTGETVAVFASSSNSSQASQILINPSYGGGSGSAPTNTSTD